MAINVVSNKTQSVFITGTPTANFEDSVVELKFASRYLRIISESGDVAFSLNGKDVDGIVKQDEDLMFEGMQASKLAFKISNAAPDIRVWAYK